uniref:SNF2-related protein n=1 Tax=Turicimonas muris TaxID=1796652 RepID=UPI0024B99A26
DMGLGKTIQTITLLLFRASQGPSLVVTPSSVLYNWRDEISRFAPSLNIHIFNSGDRKKILETAGNNDVVLCTYGVLSSEIENMSKPVWNVVVLDEAHAIKNRTSQISKNVHSLKSKARVLLTGTPIQNHLSEIWNLFDFANPGLLGSLPDFSERFIIPIEKYQDKDQQRLLKKIIPPFLLRRT